MRATSSIPGNSAMKLMILLSASIFAIETTIDLIAPHQLISTGWSKAITDSSLLVLVTFPFLYLFAFRPLNRLASGLRESEQLFRNTFDQAAVGIAHVSSNGAFLRMNSCWCTIVGYSREELMTMSFQQITHPDDLHDSLSHLASLLRGERQIYTSEKRYVRKNHSIVW